MVFNHPRKGDRVIYVSKSQLSQVEYILRQAAQGFHVLFDNDTIRKAYRDTSTEEISEDAAYGVEHHVEQLITLPTLKQKQAYLESLDPQTFPLVVKAYFNIIENNLFESQGVTH